MSALTVGLLHPGEMGVSVGAAAKAGGNEVLWASRGRGSVTRQRAGDAALTERNEITELLEESGMVVSVCPPHAANAVAREVASHDYAGIYIDANAISPGSAREIGRIVAAGGAQFVDGGIIGPPATKPGVCRVYLSGKDADTVAAIFRGSFLDARVVGQQPGQASALKMAYAAWTKGSDALVLAIRALAAREGVDAALVEEWALSQPGLTDRSIEAAAGSAPKGWRFAGEMREIASTFSACELPDGFHRAAADIYDRLHAFKNKDRAGANYRRGGGRAAEMTSS